jgi:predicted flap endonuclease-1-like 5' DNA nuclease
MQTVKHEMSAHLKRGIIVWILAFLTFLAAINVFNAVMYGVDKEAEDTISPYLIRYIIPKIEIRYYFWISVAATCLFLALTSIVAYRRLPDPHLFWKIDKLEEGIADNAETIRATQTSLLVDLENSRKAREELMDKINTTLADTRKETLSALEKHEKAIQETSKSLQKATRDMLATLEEKHSKSIQQMNITLQNATKEANSMLEKAMKKQRAKMEEVMKRVEKLEEKLLPKPKLTSQNKPEDIKGIGPQLGKELRALGITTVAELIIADPRTLAEKTRATRDTIKRLQTTAQLLMIPGIKESHTELLEETGITTRKDLASQEPIQLSQKLETIAKTYIEQGRLAESEKPTIEEIVSWIRNAKI